MEKDDRCRQRFTIRAIVEAAISDFLRWFENIQQPFSRCFNVVVLTPLLYLSSIAYNDQIQDEIRELQYFNGKNSMLRLNLKKSSFLTAIET